MGTLTRKEFDLLNAMLGAKEKLSQRKLEELTGYSLSTVNRTARDLAAKGLLQNGPMRLSARYLLRPASVPAWCR